MTNVVLGPIITGGATVKDAPETVNVVVGPRMLPILWVPVLGLVLVFWLRVMVMVCVPIATIVWLTTVIGISARVTVLLASGGDVMVDGAGRCCGSAGDGSSVSSGFSGPPGSSGVFRSPGFFEVSVFCGPSGLPGPFGFSVGAEPGPGDGP